MPIDTVNLFRIPQNALTRVNVILEFLILTIFAALSASIEQHINRLVNQSNKITSKRFPIRKAASLDSFIRTRNQTSNNADESPERSRSPSPALSSGVESNSIKDSPMQIDMLSGDSGSLDTGNSLIGNGSSGNSLESCGVVCGGSVRGWLPDVAVVLWKRMLAALGDPNLLVNPKLHAMMFDYLVKLTDTLIKVKKKPWRICSLIT